MADKTGRVVLQRVPALFLPLLSLRLPRRARLGRLNKDGQTFGGCAGSKAWSSMSA
jgi:hypothetical protein